MTDLRNEYREEIAMGMKFIINDSSVMQDWLKPELANIKTRLLQGETPEVIAKDYAGVEGEILVPEDLVIDAIKRFR